MGLSKVYLGIGEEAARGTKEVTSVGWIPLLNTGLPKMEFDEKPREEYRGQASHKGETTIRRYSRKWASSLETPFYTEAGGVAGMVGTLIKHFFGHVSSAQNATTGQYAHMFSYPDDPFATANLGAKALTLNHNVNEGAVMKNWPFVGGRVKSITFEQEPGSQLKMVVEAFGQYRDAVTAELGSQVFVAENLRCDYNALTVRQGAAPTRTGTAPDYTDITLASGNVISPDKLSIKIENGFEDALRLAGKDYADKTRVAAKLSASIDMTFDWEDPATGFSSVSDFNAWVASSSETNFLFTWDTGTQAGTGDNHSLIIDVPRAHRQGGEPDYGLDKDPMVSLSYKALMDDTTTQYLLGLLLKNTAATV